MQAARPLSPMPAAQGPRIECLSEGAWRPGLVGQCTALMARHYAATLGIGAAFEVDLAIEIARFVTTVAPRSGDLWTVVDAQGRVRGCAALQVAEASDAHPAMRGLFRWFFVEASLRGQGFGARLLGSALADARRRRLQAVDLITHPSMTAALALYRQHGFRAAGTAPGPFWDRDIDFLRLTLDLASDCAPTPEPATTLAELA
jgi:GNAT superfamily N-acetyltransferase